MNKGKQLGIVIGALLFILAWLTSSLAVYFGGTIMFLSYAMLMASGAIIFYTNMTTEGNIWISRTMGRSNDGVGVFIEAGKFQRNVTIDYNKDSCVYDGQMYRIKKEFILMRGGVPYVYFVVGIGENLDPLNLDQFKPVGDNKVVTAWMFQSMALWRAIAFSSVQQWIWIAFIALGALMVLGFALVYFGGIAPLNEALAKDMAYIVSLLPTPTPTPIPAIPVA